jgi:hypothetical protein
MPREIKDVAELKRLEALQEAYARIPTPVWEDLWRRFCGISFDENPHITSFKEGRRQVLNHMLLMAGKLTFEEMEVLWKQGKKLSKV